MQGLRVTSAVERHHNQFSSIMDSTVVLNVSCSYKKSIFKIEYPTSNFVFASMYAIALFFQKMCKKFCPSARSHYTQQSNWQPIHYREKRTIALRSLHSPPPFPVFRYTCEHRSPPSPASPRHPVKAHFDQTTGPGRRLNCSNNLIIGR